MSTYLMQRGGMWHYRRRVPGDFAHLDPRPFITQSTKIKVRHDPRGVKAALIAERINVETERYLAGVLQGDHAAAKARYDDAVRRVRALGLNWVGLGVLSDDSQIVELQRHVAALTKEIAIGRANPSMAATYAPQVAAVLGAVAPATMRISEMPAAFEELKEIASSNKSPAQKKKWKAFRERSVKYFIEAIGEDKDLSAVGHDDVRTYVDWWKAGIKAGKWTAGYANKDFGSLGGMYKKLRKHNRWDHLDQRLFDDIMIEQPKVQNKEEKRKWPAFSTEFIQTKLLADGAFDKLNAQARRAFFVMIETGMRPEEVVNLRRGHICRDHNIPHLEVKAEDREVKTANSIRDIPLVGVSLAAVDAALADLREDEDRLFPNYYDNASGWSATVGKHLRVNKLKETGRHVPYSIRHSFKTRLRKYMLDRNGYRGDELLDLMMGHDQGKEDYGEIDLEQKLEWTLDMMFKEWPRNL